MAFVGGPNRRLTNPRWRMASILKEKSINHNISAMVQPIDTKFGMGMYTDPLYPGNR